MRRNSFKRPSELNFVAGPFRQAVSVTSPSLRSAMQDIAEGTSNVFFFDRKALHRSINLDVQMSERDGECIGTNGNV